MVVVTSLYTATVKDIFDTDDIAVNPVPPVPAVTLNFPSVVFPWATLVYEANSPSKSINVKKISA